MKTPSLIQNFLSRFLPQPKKETFAELLARAKAGDAEAQRHVGEEYARGEVVKLDRDEARAWFLKAAENGDLSSMDTTALFLYADKTLPDGKVQAATWLRKAAKAGFAPAQYDLGIYYLATGSPKRDLPLACAWLRRAAEHGYALAQYDLGRCMEDEVSDYAQAASWYRRAANQGLAQAQYALGIMHWRGIGGCSNNSKTVLSYYRKAAEQGHANAQVALANAYVGGSGVERSEAKAREWFLKAAEQGNAEAQTEMALFLRRRDEDGREGEDLAAAFEYCRLACEQDYPQAQTLMGFNYKFGIGVEANEAESAAWFLKAADNGDTMAMYELEKCYEVGRGVAKDEKQELAWRERSSEVQQKSWSERNQRREVFWRD